MRLLKEVAPGLAWAMSISNCNFDSLVAKVEIDGHDVLLLVDSKAIDVSIASKDGSDTNVSRRFIVVFFGRSITKR